MANLDKEYKKSLSSPVPETATASKKADVSRTSIEELQLQLGQLTKLDPLEPADPMLSMMKSPEPFYEPMPTRPEEPGPGLGTKIARAAILLLSGASGDPDLPNRLAYQFRQDDDNVRQQVYDSYNNRLALALQQRTDVNKQVEMADTERRTKLGEKEDARRAQADQQSAAIDRIQLGLSILGSQRDEMQMRFNNEMRARGIANEDTLAELRTIDRVEAGLQMKLRLIQKPSTRAISTSEAFLAMTEDEKKMPALEGMNHAKDRLAAKRITDYTNDIDEAYRSTTQSVALMRTKASSWSAEAKLALDLFSDAISVNDSSSAANAISQAVQADPEMVQKGLEEAAKQFVVEGRFHNVQEAMSKIVEMHQKDENANNWKLPAVGTYGPPSELQKKIKKVIGPVFENTGPGQAVKYIKKAREKVKNGPPSATGNF